MNPDLGRMERVDGLCGDEEGEYYTLVANVKCLKRNVRLVIWYPKGLAGVSEKGGGYKLFFSTDTQMDAGKCVAVYKSRFQLEFVFYVKCLLMQSQPIRYSGYQTVV